MKHLHETPSCSSIPKEFQGISETISFIQQEQHYVTLTILKTIRQDDHVENNRSQ